jgi:hypothetical protein
MELRTVDNKGFDEALKQGLCGFAVTDRTGDHKSIWDPENPDEVEAAEHTFNSLKKKGYLAFRVNEGNKGDQMKEFDPKAGKVIMTQPPVGG